ncbi:MAG: hypothetical protein JW787_02835 [Sedimentisphaerales bacterium]|nr:hypothetical protein [Sedimentisphaerales bacterium]
MNKKQKVILFIGIIIFVIMGIYPPWVLNRSSGIEAGYWAFINDPPRTAKFIDLYRLGVQWFMVAVVIGSLLVILKDKKKD